jgi:hypothetical protein
MGSSPRRFEALEKNIKLQPFSPYGYYQLAMTQHHLGDSGDAWRTYEQLKNFEPRYAATLKRDIENTSRRKSAPAVVQAPPHPNFKGGLNRKHLSTPERPRRLTEETCN